MIGRFTLLYTVSTSSGQSQTSASKNKKLEEDPSTWDEASQVSAQRHSYLDMMSRSSEPILSHSPVFRPFTTELEYISFRWSGSTRYCGCSTIAVVSYTITFQRTRARKSKNREENCWEYFSVVLPHLKGARYSFDETSHCALSSIDFSWIWVAPGILRMCGSRQKPHWK